MVIHLNYSDLSNLLGGTGAMLAYTVHDTKVREVTLPLTDRPFVYVLDDGVATATFTGAFANTQLVASIEH